MSYYDRLFDLLNDNYELISPMMNRLIQRAIILAERRSELIQLPMQQLIRNVASQSMSVEDAVDLYSLSNDTVVSRTAFDSLFEDVEEGEIV